MTQCEQNGLKTHNTPCDKNGQSRIWADEQNRSNVKSKITAQCEKEKATSVSTAVKQRCVEKNTGFFGDHWQFTLPICFSASLQRHTGGLFDFVLLWSQPWTKRVNPQYDRRQRIAGTVKAVILERWPFVPHHLAEIKNETSTKNAAGKRTPTLHKSIALARLLTKKQITQSMICWSKNAMAAAVTCLEKKKKKKDTALSSCRFAQGPSPLLSRAFGQYLAIWRRVNTSRAQLQYQSANF